MIELIHGEGTIEKRIPAMFRMFMQYGIDMRKEPILVYPTLHYQNGGLEINGEGFTNTVNNLLVAGEILEIEEKLKHAKVIKDSEINRYLAVMQEKLQQPKQKT